MDRYGFQAHPRWRRGRPRRWGGRRRGLAVGVQARGPVQDRGQQAGGGGRPGAGVVAAGQVPGRREVGGHQDEDEQRVGQAHTVRYEGQPQVVEEDQPAVGRDDGECAGDEQFDPRG
ncbi:hypothetical protein SAZ11_60225 [Streptomyces sp. FXJ1.4098]|nr:hypothetical protein [Streptomyces sp. FXJ1.4098]